MKIIIEIMLVTIIAILFFSLGMFWQQTQYYNKEEVSTRLCNQAVLGLSNTSFLNGFYDSDGYYCVRTDNSWYETRATDYHEACHALVNKDYEHFCEE